MCGVTNALDLLHQQKADNSTCVAKYALIVYIECACVNVCLIFYEKVFYTVGML